MSPTQIAIAVVRHDDRFLIGQRPAGTPLAGCWEFPGGKVKTAEGESTQDAARRECLEETNVLVAVGGEYLAQVESYEHGAVHLHFFDCVPVDVTQTPREPFRWVARANLSDYTFPAGNRAILDLLLGRE